MPEPNYRVLLENRVEKDLDKLENEAQRRIIARLLLLKREPRPQGAKKLEGSKSAWRIRIGDWRAIYEINDKKREIKIYRIKYRSEGY